MFESPRRSSGATPMTASRGLIATVAAILALVFGDTVTAVARPSQERRVVTSSLTKTHVPRDAGSCKRPSTKRNSNLSGYRRNLNRGEDLLFREAGGQKRLAALGLLLVAFVKPGQFAPRLGSAVLTAFPIEPHGYDAQHLLRVSHVVVATWRTCG